MSDFNHALNLTHDGTLILRIPKGYEVDKVVVEEMGTENRKKFVHMPADISDYCDELWEKAYERGKAEGQAEIIRCKDCRHEDGVGYCKLLFMDVMPMWFCCLGMRRSDSDE